MSRPGVILPTIERLTEEYDRIEGRRAEIAKELSSLNTDAHMLRIDAEDFDIEPERRHEADNIAAKAGDLAYVLARGEDELDA